MMLAVLCPGGEAGGELLMEQGLGDFGSGGRSARAHLPGAGPQWSGRFRCAPTKSSVEHDEKDLTPWVRTAAHPDVVEDDEAQVDHLDPLMMKVS